MDTSIAKVAETPLEGSDASAMKTFGPFESDPAAGTKTPNSKGYSVHFEQPKPDPIEKAFDSIIMFIDDVREASSSPRGDGKGCMNAMSEALDAKLTFDCVREARNPCADTCSESFGKMQPPVDLMLNVDDLPGPVEEGKSGEYELKEATLEAPAPTKSAESVESSKPAEASVLDKDTSEKADKDTSAEESDKEAAAKGRAVKNLPPKGAKVSTVDPGSMMPTYSPVETIADKLRTSVPQDTIQKFMDTFVQMSGGAKSDGAKPAATENNAETDPLVECIDKLILFFDDVQESVAEQRSRMVADKGETQQKDDYKKVEASATEEGKEGDVGIEADFGGSDNTTMSEDTMKVSNAVLDKVLEKEPTYAVTSSEVVNKAEEDYMKAVASAEALLASPIVPGQKHEESHKEALEKIMAEDETSVDAGKTNELKLEDLIKEADQAIMDTRSADEADEADEAEEELVVLGHSATLTPIPEADEASAGTPSSEMMEEGVANGAAPEVPLAPSEQESKSEANDKPEAQDPAAATEATEAESSSTDAAVKDTEGEADPSAKQEPQKEEHQAARYDVKNVDEEVDPIVYFIDKIFLFFDDIQQGEPIAKSCEGCLGAAVPSDLVDQSEEIVQEKEEGNDAKDGKDEDETPVDSRGQLMLQEALKLVKQANSDADDLVDKLAVTFTEAEKAERATINPDAASTKMVGIQKKIITAHGIELEDNEQNRAIAKLVESAFAEKEKLRSAWNAVVGNPAGKGDEQGLTTPQMSDVDNAKQSKVEFEIPELIKQNEDPCIAWGGDDSELMASINADRKLSELEHENIFRDVSKGLQESSAGIITREDNQDVFSIYNAPAFTEGNSGSNELPDDNPARAALKVLFAEANSTSACAESEQQPASNDATSKTNDSGKAFEGWALSKKREEMLRAKQTSQQ